MKGSGVAVRDLFDVHERQIFEIAALLGVEELLCTAHDGSLQAGAVRVLLQIKRIPLADHIADCRRIVVAAEKSECRAPDARDRCS